MSSPGEHLLNEQYVKTFYRKPIEVKFGGELNLCTEPKELAGFTLEKMQHVGWIQYDAIVCSYWLTGTGFAEMDRRRLQPVLSITPTPPVARLNASFQGWAA